MVNYFLYFGMSLVVFCWVLTPFLRKIVLKKATSLDFFMCTQLIVLLYILLTFIVLKIRNPSDYNFKSILDLNKKEISILFLGALATYFSSIALIWLLKYNEATQIMPQLQPIVIVLTILAGVFIFKEKVSLMECVGVGFIILGVIILNYFKSNK
jgi:uncharacterized membrane protein